MEKMNEILGVKLLNLWIMRGSGIPIFIKNYEETFAFGNGVTDPMIGALLSGFLGAFNRGIVGKNCEEMRFGDIVFTFHYQYAPIFFWTFMISRIRKNGNVVPYLIALTETISKMFTSLYREVLVGLNKPLEEFKPFADKLDATIEDFISKLCNNEEELNALRKIIKKNPNGL